MPADDPQQPTGILRNTAANAFDLVDDDDLGFAGLVTVSFSAFDSKGPLGGATSGLKRYEYIGLVTKESDPFNPADHRQAEGA